MDSDSENDTDSSEKGRFGHSIAFDRNRGRTIGLWFEKVQAEPGSE